MRAVGLLGIVAVSALTVVACAEKEDGAPVSQAGGASASPSASSAPSQDVFAGVEACDLLEPITSKRNFDPAEEETLHGEVGGCQASKPRYGSASISLRDIPVEDLVESAGRIEDMEIEGRAAKQAKGAGQCTIAIEVTDGARADIGASVRIKTEDPCPDVVEMAEELAPNLPKG